MKTKQNLKEIILNTTINTIVIFSFILLLFVIDSKYVKKDRIVNLLGKSILVVTTESMAPSINSGDLIIISRDNNYKKDDIVTFIDDDICITHRIIKEENDNFITRGDANNIDDKPITKNQIIGKVIYHSHILGIIVLYFLKPMVIIYFLFSVLILLIKYIRTFEREKDEQTKEGTIENKETK